MEFSLNELEWQVKGFWPWVPEKNNSMETGKLLQGVTNWLPATVPGGVHYDLYRAGLIDYPYRDMNSQKCEWVENRWWLYQTSFTIPDVTGVKYELVFKGLDYQADIYLNGTFLGTQIGMYESFSSDITSHIEPGDEVKLKILFKGIPEEMGQIGKTSLSRTQKSRFNYQWDFSTRLVNIGIWDDVFLKIHQSYSLKDIFIKTDVENIKNQSLLKGKLSISAVLDNNGEQDLLADLTLLLICLDPTGEIVLKEKVAVKELLKNNLLSEDDQIITLDRLLKSPHLWYPNGYGKQPLYKLKLKLLNGNEVLDQNEQDIGFRSLSYQRNEASPADSLPYTIVINGERVYIKGVNITPLDHLYGNVTAAHYEHMIRKMKEANINLVRVWGGGIIEKDIFYKLCDCYGIMVWQDFIQSSSGVDNIPSKLPGFLELLKKTATAALKGRRNHVSLTIWCGGNELMSARNTPSTSEDKNLSILKELVKQYDSGRLFLPTTASGPVEFATTEKNTAHDVHGMWIYLGNPDHYQFYNQTDHLLHSEFGVDGLANYKTLKKNLNKKNQYPANMDDNLVWRHLGHFWDTSQRDQELFTKFEDLKTFSHCSQWIQAEGVKYIIEANRRRKFQNSGSIVWQFNEPWPNVSCTNMLDYFGDTKMAYHWMAQAYAPNIVSLKYDKLNYLPGKKFKGEIYADILRDKGPYKVRAKIIDITGKILYQQEENFTIEQDKSIMVGSFSCLIKKDWGELFFVRLELIADNLDHKSVGFYQNLYIFSTRDKQIYAPSLELKEGKLAVKPLNEWQNNTEWGSCAQENKGYCFNSKLMYRKFRLKNVGKHVLLHIYPQEISNGFWISSDQSHFSLFPGEEKIIRIHCIKKQAGGFLKEDQPDVTEPEIHFDSFK